VFDDDEGLVIYEPEPPALAELRALLARKRHDSGGRVMIGRSLYRLLLEAGLQEVTVIAQTFNTTQVKPQERPRRMNHLSALTRSLAALEDSGAVSKADAARYRRALEEVAANPLGFAFACSFFACGRKPLRCA